MPVSCSGVQSSVSLLILCLDDLSIIDSGILKSPIIFILLFVLLVLLDFAFIFRCLILIIQMFIVVNLF